LRDALTRVDPQAGMQAVAPNLEVLFGAATHRDRSGVEDTERAA